MLISVQSNTSYSMNGWVTGPDPEGLGGFKPLLSNGRGLILSYNFIRKEKISNASSSTVFVGASRS